MAAKSPLAAVLATLLLAACRATPEESQLAALAAAAPKLLQASGDIPQSAWPAGLAQLDPERVRVTPEGLYVVLSSAGVEERGLFVPRTQGFAGSRGTDPSYTRLGQGVFSYHVKG